jgi:hypothetical protein
MLVRTLGVCREFAPPRHHVLSVPEHSRAQLYGLRQRYRPAAALHASMDFAAWMKVYLSGRWHSFDSRNNAPRIGRILIAYGRDAADVPLTHIFGPGDLRGFQVWTELGRVRPIEYGPRSSGLKSPAHMEVAVRASVCRPFATEVKVRIDRIAKWPAAFTSREARYCLSLFQRDR